MWIETSLMYLQELIDISREHRWNIHFSLPKLSNDLPQSHQKPVTTWYIWDVIYKEEG